MVTKRFENPRIKEMNQKRPWKMYQLTKCKGLNFVEFQVAIREFPSGVTEARCREKRCDEHICSSLERGGSLNFFF